MSSFTNPFPIPLPPNFGKPGVKQAIAVPGSEKPGFTPVYVSAVWPELPNPNSNPTWPKTAKECFDLGLKSGPDKNCLGKREWDPVTGDWAKTFTWETYAQVDERRKRIGSGIKYLQREKLLGDAPEKVSVGIWAPNRPEWQWVNQATAAYSLVTVSLYETLGPTVVEYCINHAECYIVFCASTHVATLLELTKTCPNLKCIVSLDRWDELVKPGATRPGATSEAALKAWGKQIGVTVLDIQEIENFGQANPVPFISPAPSDIASFCYTSGTTGNPKGAILLHSSLAGAAVTNLHGGALANDGVFFSYLPLSHIYERFCEDVAFAAGAAIGYTCGDNLRLLEDMQILKPTFIVSVPRVLNRIYQAIKAATLDAPGLKGKMARKAFADKLYNLEHFGQVTHAFWDKIIFNKVKLALGGRVQFIGTGSAPINPSVLSFLRVAFCCEVTEGYGQTENCGTAVKCLASDYAPNGTVGPPGAGMEIRLRDVPDMEYFSTDKPFPRGEILVKGMAVIPGYYKDEKKSKETVDAEGWLYSGDIGLIDELGRVKIIDRIKNLVKLSQGEYVAVEKVENVYALCPLLAQIYVHADSLQDHVVGLLVLDPVAFAPFASKVTGKQIAADNMPALNEASQNPSVKKAVAAELDKYAKQARLLKYECIGEDIHLTFDAFTTENDMLTPTFKAKRNNVAAAYQKILDALYGKRAQGAGFAAKL